MSVTPIRYTRSKKKEERYKERKKIAAKNKSLEIFKGEKEREGSDDRAGREGNWTTPESEQNCERRLTYCVIAGL